MQLQRNALSALDSTLIAVSATAPANTLATSTAALVAAVGLGGPGVLLVCAVPMIGIAMAYFFLNAWRSDAGAAYAWVGRSLDPQLGFFAGWSLVVAIILFSVAGSLPMASATLDLVAPSLTTNTVAVVCVGLAWFLVVVGIVLLGIKATANVQKAVTLIQIVGLAVFAAGAVMHWSSSPANHVSWSWWWPFAGAGVHNFVAGALVALFFFWGWDVSANLTEETVGRQRTPGVSGVLGMLIILTLYVVTVAAVQLSMSTADITASNANLLVAFAARAVPKPWSDLAVIIVLISTIGALETSLVQAGRTLFSMGRDRVLDERLAALNARFLTPWDATLLISGIGVCLFALAAASPSVNDVLSTTINAIGVLIAIYYGLSGLACARYYGAANRREPAMFWLRGVFPIGSAIFVFAVAIAQLLSAGWRADAVIGVLLAAGLIPMWYYRRRYRSAFFTSALESSTTTQARSLV